MALDRALERRRAGRRDFDGDLGLNRDDLFLLLESYRNTIELNTTLLERQDTLNAGLKKLLSEQINLCTNQAVIAADIGRLSAETFSLIQKHRTDEISEHSSLSLRIYAAFSVVGALALALLGLLIKIWPTITTYAPTPGP
jgi:hypothetical protein